MQLQNPNLPRILETSNCSEAALNPNLRRTNLHRVARNRAFILGIILLWLTTSLFGQTTKKAVYVPYADAQPILAALAEELPP